MQKEIEFAQTEIKALEDKILERMLEADELTAAVKRTEGELAADQKAVDAERRRWRQRSPSSDVTRTGRRRARRRHRRARPEGARHLRAVAQRRHGVAVAEARGASARSATCGCGRRCSTPCGATKRSFSATAASASCTSCPRAEPPAGRQQLAAAGAMIHRLSSPTSTAARAVIPVRPATACASSSATARSSRSSASRLASPPTTSPNIAG